jgi:hypothetical protein
MMTGDEVNLSVSGGHLVLVVHRQVVVTWTFREGKMQ